MMTMYRVSAITAAEGYIQYDMSDWPTARNVYRSLLKEEEDPNNFTHDVKFDILD